MSFSKQDTLVVKGVAILMLIGYHCFSSVDRLHGVDVEFILPQSTAITVYEVMNICVGMFVFLSVYGLTKSWIKYSSGGGVNSPLVPTTFVTKRLMSLYSSFVLPAVLAIIATAFIRPDYSAYGDTWFEWGVSFVAEMFGVSCFVGTGNFIGTWWYMSLAVAIVCLIPAANNMFKKYGLLVIIPFALVPVLFDSFAIGTQFGNMTSRVLAIPLGIIFARLDVMERLKLFKVTKNKTVSKLIKFFVLTAILAVLFVMRSRSYLKDNSHYSYYVINGFLPVYFSYWLYEFVADIPVLKSILAYFGKHSSNIFYLHTFIRWIWFADFTYSLKYAWLIFAFVLACSLAMSYIVEFIKYITKYSNGVKMLTDKLIKWENNLFAITSH